MMDYTIRLANKQIKNNTGENSPSEERCKFCGSILKKDKKPVTHGRRINGAGCAGICIRYDTRSCYGNGCSGCEVCEAGLCSRKYLLRSANANVIERDGGDYRNLMGDFFRKLRLDAGYDKRIRDSLSVNASNADTFMEAVRNLVISAEDKSLIFEWSKYTLDDLLTTFPQAARKPVRIEMQMLIYMFFNFRYRVDIEHAEERFLISRHVLNRYLHRFFGYSYSSLLSKIRNGRSKTLLSIPLLCVGDIAEIVGYKSLCHFSTIFKRHEGVSPNEYRKSLINAAHHFENKYFPSGF